MSRRNPYPGWTRLSAPGDKISAQWRHSSGWLVRHCGHPTANFPYHAIDPKQQTRCTMTHNGKGFTTLEVAFTAVTAVLIGKARLTLDRCGPNTQRLMMPGDPP